MIDHLVRARQLALAKAQRVQSQMLPELIEGPGSLHDACDVLKDQGVSCAMIITTEGFIKRGTLGQFLNDLLSRGITTAIFDEVIPNPDVECANKAAAFFRSRSCDAIIAIGGGSVIDCAKLAGALAVKPQKSPLDFAGLFRVRKETPFFVAVPTTAGSGSEATSTAMIADSGAQRFRFVSDFVLIPNVAVLDPTLLLSLPPEMTAWTGMDALAHAVEAYTNRFAPLEARRYARDAIEAIFENLKPSFDDGKQLISREAMLVASYWAGIASASAGTGYIHILSHGIAGRYRLHYGLASAILMPVVLEEYGDAVERRLAELGELIGLPETSDRAMAQGFIRAIRELATSVGIPTTLSQIRAEDIPSLAANADEEANPTCPTPMIWHYSVFQKILRRVMEKPDIASWVIPSAGTANGNEAQNEQAPRPAEEPLDSANTASRQLRITKPGPLLDEDGRLRALGFATQPLLDYNRKLIKSSVLRIKEWDYYLVNDDSYALALTVGDMGYAALVSASLIDFEHKTFTTQSTMDLLPLGKLGLPRSSDAGVTDYSDKRASMRFEVAGGLRRLTVSFSDFLDGAKLDAEVVLDAEPRDSMVIATPWAESATAFYYNRKIVGMHAVGSFTLGSKRHVFREDSSLGLLDWGRGVWTRDNTWYWSAAQGRLGSQLVGFNLGYGFGDTSAATENMLFVDGVAHKLGHVDFGIPIRREKARAIGDRFDLMKPWRITDDEGRLDLVFSPEIDRCDRMDFKVVVSDQHQVFGRFTGTAVLDDGSTLEITNLRGFAEAVHNVY